MQTISKNNLSIITSESLKDKVTEQWFDQEYWTNQGRLLGANSGRGSTWVIKSDWGKWVLRHYFRGGLFAKLNGDRYFWTGLKNTRAYKEYLLLDAIQKLDLPSPSPVAAMVVKHGMFYSNDLIMEHIHHEMTFAQGIKQDTSLDLSVWHRVGQTIAQYHKKGIFHADLNAHNILLNNEQVFIIDFDKGEIRKPHPQWQQNNMNRLQRSIEKVSKLSCEDQLSDQWQSLLEGYHAQ